MSQIGETIRQPILNFIFNVMKDQITNS